MDRGLHDRALADDISMVGNAEAARVLDQFRQAGAGWVMLAPEAVPPRWRGRALIVALVPLAPQEQADILVDGRAQAALDPECERLASLLARGVNVGRVARELGLSRRSVERRIARLRTKFGAVSTSELAALLAARGFAASADDRDPSKRR